MNRFQLKIFAVVTMLIDHIGAALFPGVIFLRIIGRLSFPVFAYLLTEGLLHTSNIRKYFGRLFLFALVSEIPFDLAFHSSVFYPNSQNIFFTLFFGLAAIALLQKISPVQPVGAAMGAVSLALIAELLHTDYGWYGVAVVVLFYLGRKYPTKGLVLFSLLTVGYGLAFSPLESYAVLAGIPIFLYSGFRGKWNWKYFFYVFYPAHLLLLYWIHTVAI